MTDWRVTTLGEVCTLRAGSVFKTAAQGNGSGDLPFIKVSDMNLAANRTRIQASNNWVSAYQARQLKAKPFPPGTSVFAKIGEALKHNRVRLLTRDTIIDNNMMAAIPADHVSGPFLFRALQALNLAATATGTAVPYLTVSALNQTRLLISDLENQVRVATVLDTIDDLIENNRRRVEVLEEMARVIYREWFVHFRYPGHEDVPLIDSPFGPIPDGWVVRSLFDVADVAFGFSFKSKWFTDDGPFPVIRIRDVASGITKTFTNEQAPERYRVIDGDILIGMDGEFHLRQWADSDGWLNQRVARLRPLTGMCGRHLMLAVEDPVRSWNMAISGTTVAHLGKRHLEQVKVVQPVPDLLARASETMGSAADEVRTLLQLNRRLTDTRDMLLPKLVTGEIDVSMLDLDSVLGESV